MTYFDLPQLMHRVNEFEYLSRLEVEVVLRTAGAVTLRIMGGAAGAHVLGFGTIKEASEWLMAPRLPETDPPAPA